MPDWYYAKNGEQHGPVSKIKLVGLFESGELKDSTLVWTSGMDEWKRADDLEQKIISSPSSPPPVQTREEGAKQNNPNHFQERANNDATTEQPPSTAEGASKTGGFFTTRGRTNRLKYFLQILIPSFIAVVGNGIASAASPEAAGFGALILLTGGILTIFPAVRRLHDINVSGWYFLFSLVPLANLILGLILLFKKGTEGSNQYGPDPLGGTT